MSEGRFKVAAVQMVSGPEVQANLADAGELIARAAGEGAQLVALPEYFCILGLRERFRRIGSGVVCFSGDTREMESQLQPIAQKSDQFLIRLPT